MYKVILKYPYVQFQKLFFFFTQALLTDSLWYLIWDDAISEDDSVICRKRLGWNKYFVKRLPKISSPISSYLVKPKEKLFHPSCSSAGRVKADWLLPAQGGSNCSTSLQFLHLSIYSCGFNGPSVRPWILL